MCIQPVLIHLPLVMTGGIMIPCISFRVALTSNATTVFAEGGGYGATGTHREHHAGSLRGGACSSRGLI